MAPPQTIERALRERFGSEETILTLAEILAFLKSHQNSLYGAGSLKERQTQHATRQSAPPPKGQSRGQTRKERATQGSYNGTATKAQATQPTQPQQQPQSPQGPQNQNEKTPKPQNQEPKRQPSYADIAKKALEKAPRQLGKPKKATTLPESVKLAPKALKPLKIVLREPIKNTPSELILQIKDRAVNGERLTSLIKAFRILTPKSLLVYLTTEAAREELSQNTSWLDAIHASIYARKYSIVIYRVRKDISTDEISRRIKEQNPILQENLASVHWLGKTEPLGTLRVDIKDPIVANRAILRGITLDYEFKKVYQYIPRKKTPMKQREKLFYKEKTPTLPSRVMFRASNEASEPRAQEEDWTLVEGTQKRRYLTPKGRGRPKAFERIDTSHGNIDKFVVLASQIPPTAIPETQGSIASSQQPPESIDVD
jgi:hypothetical protein